MNQILKLFKNRNFSLLWAGELISLIGDQFYLIALPWLVLQMTGDSLAVGTVLAVAGIPRALFMLIGGALTDRFSARALMLASNLFRFGLVTILAVLVAFNLVQLWMVYLLALAFGLADAFFYPAQSAIVPKLVDENQLPSANGIVHATAQLSLLLGPVLAGWLVATMGSSAGSGTDVVNMSGIAIAFGIDSITFLVSAFTLAFIQVIPKNAEIKSNKTEKANTESVFQSIREGLAFVWADETLSIFFILVIAIANIINGVIAVGLPVLADGRFEDGAVAFGLMLSGIGAGSLIGTAFAALMPSPPKGHLGTVILLVTSVMAVGIMLLSWAPTSTFATAITTSMGLASGYVNITFITWLQRRTPEAMLGRMMSVLMFASIGLVPISTALVGFIIRFNLPALFIGGGLIILTIIGYGLTNPLIREMAVAPTEQFSAAGD